MGALEKFFGDVVAGAFDDTGVTGFADGNAFAVTAVRRSDLSSTENARTVGLKLLPRSTPKKKTPQKHKISTMLIIRICSSVVLINIGLCVLASTLKGSGFLEAGENSWKSSCCVSRFSTSVMENQYKPFPMKRATAGL